ncbi:DUF3052 domain-containing protein [Demequina aurantiaca]|uniref:DUF3052 domain-containing protein n=1 Tax=Demequina aurantiaca TaxID=676200 RepID=UPI0009FF241E|nr:DUF3052 domain-containing protein [Demequina aurantiaca]
MTRSDAAVATQEDPTSVDETMIARFGLDKGHIIQEFGYDDDVEKELRVGIEDATGEAIVFEDFGDVTDGALVWFRDGDEDLADLLMDAQALLDDGASMWVLTPKKGVAGHVEPRIVGESASLAGLHATSTFVVGDSWSCTQLVEKGRSK